MNSKMTSVVLHLALDTMAHDGLEAEAADDGRAARVVWAKVHLQAQTLLSGDPVSDHATRLSLVLLRKCLHLP